MQNWRNEDTQVRKAIYRHFIDTAAAPTVRDIAGALSLSEEQVVNEFQRLAADKVIVLAPATHNIWMAHPFSAVPTPYRVTVEGKGYWANCAWDAFGIPAIIGRGGAFTASCPECKESISVAINDDAVSAQEGIVHFLIPPRDFWINVAYT